MSAGTKIVQMRFALAHIVPYARHKVSCDRTNRGCTCGLEQAISTAARLAKIDPARTCGPNRVHHPILAPKQ